MFRISRRYNLSNVRMHMNKNVSSLYVLNNLTQTTTPKPSSFWLKLTAASSVALGAAASQLYESLTKDVIDGFESDDTTIINFSGTHQVSTTNYVEPTSPLEVTTLLRQCNEQGIRLRAVGSGLSPNGIGFANSGMVNMVQCDKILHVDKDKMQVTVQTGCTVQELLEGIRPYNLTLENIASIAQQQIGGFLQVGAHGTGATIPPCDMQIVSMNIATPEHGIIHLSEESNADLFHLARVGLGAFGVVTEVTIQCVPQHTLSEKTFVISHDEAQLRRDELVGTHRHVRYMWIPFTDSVVVVSSDPTDKTLFGNAQKNDLRLPTKSDDVAKIVNNMSEEERLLPLSNLLRTVYQESGLTIGEANNALIGQSFAGIRDLLLAAGPGPLDTQHVQRINECEAEYWKNCTGGRTDWSDRVLAFDCGGQQWVYEICFKAGSAEASDGRDIAFVRELLEIIEEQNIPAPSPIEQRWTARSTSKLSPAFSDEERDVFTWVGIIMYMPTQDSRMRQHVTNEFHAYSQVLNRLCEKYGAVGHWAKIETQLLSRDERLKLQERLENRYEHIDEWKTARKSVDPNGIMLNDVVIDCFNL